MKYKFKHITTVTPDPIIKLPKDAIIVSATSERMLYPPIKEYGTTIISPIPAGYVSPKIIKSWTIFYLEPIIRREK